MVRVLGIAFLACLVPYLWADTPQSSLASPRPVAKARLKPGKVEQASAKKLKPAKKTPANNVRIAAGVRPQPRKPSGKRAPAPYRDAALLPDSRENWLLREARAMIEVGKFGRAIESMNEAFLLNPDAMVGLDEEEFVPIAKACRLLLKQMPKDALGTHRLLADPIAAKKLQSWEDSADTALLLEIYRGSFFSSYGDDAAYLIGCSYLDQGRYPEAMKVLTDAAFTHPDCNLKPEDLWPRLALAAKRSGDLVMARDAWQRYERATTEIAPHWREIGEALRETSAEHPTPAGKQKVVFGADLSGESTWLVAWTMGGQFDSAAVRRTMLLKRFTESGVVIHGSTAFHRGDELTSVRLDDGRVNWSSAISQNTRRHYNRQLPGHNWAKMMTSFGSNRVMALDGYPMAYYRPTFTPNSLVAMDAKTGKTSWRIGASVRYHRGNQTHHIGGQIVLGSDNRTPSSWDLPGRRFRATPVSWRDRLLALYEGTEGTVLAAIEPQKGIPMWQTRLSSSVDEGKIGGLVMATDSLNAYISSDNGDIAAVDATSGTPLWYFRGFHRQIAMPSTVDGQPVERAPDKADGLDEQQNGTGAAQKAEDVARRPGWLDTQVLLTGESLLAFPHSHPFVVAFSKRSGKRKWMVVKPADTNYVVGHSNGVVVVAGHKMVRAFDAKDGKEIWESPCEMAIGRGFVSGDAAFIPLGRTVRKLGLRTGKRVATLKVVTPADVPVTSIHPYKGDLLVATSKELYRIHDATVEIRDLHARIKRNPSAEDLLRRGQIRLSTGNHEGAIRDLHAALGMLTDKTLRKSARNSIVMAFGKAKFEDPSKWYDLVRNHDFDNLQRVTMSWMEGQHLEQNGEHLKAFRIYSGILGTEGETFFPGEPGSQTWFVQHEQAVWARLRTIAKASTEVRSSVERLRSELRSRTRNKPGSAAIIRLVNLDLDLVDADLLKAATADLESKELPGVAALVCRRVMQNSKYVKAKRYATIRYFQLMGRRLPVNNLSVLLDQAQKEDGDWVERVLKPELKRLKIVTQSPKFQGDPLELELAWKATGGVPIGITSDGLFCVDYRKNRVRLIDSRTGKVLKDQTVDATQIRQMARRLQEPVIMNGRNNKVQFLDSISAKVFHQVDGMPGAYGTSPAGYYPIRTDKHNGTVQYMDPVAKQVLWERREMSLAQNRWYRFSYVPGARDISILNYRDGKRLASTYQFPTGAIIEQQHTANRSYHQRDYYRGRLDGKKLTILHQNKTPIFEMPLKSSARSIWCHFTNGVLLAPLPDNHYVILRVDGDKKVDKVIYSGKLGQFVRLARVVGNYIIYSTTERSKQKRITYCGILGLDGKKYDVTLPFKEHINRTARYAAYQIYAETKDTLIITNRQTGEIFAYSCKRDKQ